MSELLSETHPSIVFASANVADPRGPLKIYNPEDLGYFVQSMADEHGQPYFDGGVELHPVMDLWAATPKRVAQAVADHKLVLNSLHASFRGTRRSHEINTLPEEGQRQAEKSPLAARVVGAAMASPLGRLLMPEVVNSSHYMADVQKRIGREVPVVLYPQLDVRLDAKARGAAHSRQKLIQPTDHVARLVGARCPEELVEKLIESNKYSGFVLDTFHAQRQYGRSEKGVISNLTSSLPIMAPYIKAGHLSLGRDDIPHESTELTAATMRDVERALNGEFDGPTGEMVDLLSDQKVGYVVLEMTAGSLGKYIGTSAIDLHKGYTYVGRAMRDALAN
ncbi:MAG: hypothetical protein ACQR33_03770 [Candidatus Saccharibacteria bacterium]